MKKVPYLHLDGVRDVAVSADLGRRCATYTLSTALTNEANLEIGARPLLATGLGALGLVGWRRKRKQAA